MSESSQSQVFRGDVSDAWEALADFCRSLRGLSEEFLVVFAEGQGSIALDLESEGRWALLLPHLSTAVEKNRVLGSMAWLSQISHPDPMPPAVAATVERMIAHYKTELVPAAEWAFTAIREAIARGQLDELGSAVTRHCASDIEEPGRQWVLDVGFQESLRLFCLAGYQPQDEDLFTGLCSPRENGGPLSMDLFVGHLSFTKTPLQEHSVPGAWRAFVRMYTETRPRWKDIAERYEKLEMLLHARSVLQAMAEGFIRHCMDFPSEEPGVDWEDILEATEDGIPAALHKLALLATKSQLFEEAHFYWKRLQRHVTSGPGSVDLDPAEIELHLMECRKQLNWFGSKEEADRTNGLLRENWDLRKAIADLAGRLRSGEVRQQVLGQVRSGVLAQLKIRFGESWDRLYSGARDNLADAASMMELHAEGRNCGFDLRKAIVMQTAWAVEAQLWETLFFPQTRLQLGWDKNQKPTLHEMITEWMSPGQFGDKTVRIVSEPQRLTDSRLIDCLRELSVQRNRAAHGYSQEQFESFRMKVFESTALAETLGILVDFRKKT